MVKSIKKNKINFFLEDSLYRKIQLIIYFLSILLILLIYFILVYLFKSEYDNTISAFFSILLGIIFIYYRNLITKKISNFIYEIRRKKIKKLNKFGLEKTIRKIGFKKEKILLKSIQENRKILAEKSKVKEKKINLKKRKSNRFNIFKKKSNGRYIEIK